MRLGFLKEVFSFFFFLFFFFFLGGGSMKIDENSLYCRKNSSYLLNHLRNFNEIFRKDVNFDNIKSHKKTGFHPLFRRYIFRKTTVGVQLTPLPTPPPPPTPAVLGLRSLNQKCLNSSDQLQTVFLVITTLKLLTKLRLVLSHLREHKFKHSFQDTLNPFCSRGKEVETTFHFLLTYPNYSDERFTLLGKIRNINPNILENTTS